MTRTMLYVCDSAPLTSAPYGRNCIILVIELGPFRLLLSAFSQRPLCLEASGIRISSAVLLLRRDVGADTARDVVCFRYAASQQFLELVGGHRPAEIVPLRIFTAQRPEKFELFLRFNSLGNDP